MNDNTLDLIKNYYQPYTREQIEEINSQVLAGTKKYSPLIKILKSRFKELVIARNKLAQKNGFNNYFDFIANWDGIPKDKLDKFLENGRETTKIIVIVEALETKFDLPDDVLKFLTSKLKIKKEILSEIELRKSDNFNFTTGNDFKKKKVWIEYNDKRSPIDTAIGLAHEYGHAIEQLKLISAGINPEDKTSYYHEEKAIETEIKFVKSLPENIKKAYKTNWLHIFANTFFEEKIYKDPNCDYGMAYVDSYSKILPSIEQNPDLYVLNTFFIEYPCYSTIYSVIYNDKLKYLL